MKKVLIVFGTRPEAIKMAPLIKELKANVGTIKSKICVSGQHKQMLYQILELFQITPDYDMSVMKKNQSLTDLTGKVIIEISKLSNKRWSCFIVIEY